MRKCAVLNCTNSQTKLGKASSVPNRITYHLFPKDPETRRAWIYSTGRLNWTPRQYSTICSVHFTEYDFTYKNGKRFLRSTTVPRFNLNEQNSRYTESQYHNETQAALEFLTGQMFPESQVPVQQETEVVTVQVIGGNNPNVVVKKPKTLQPESTPKKPKYFSLVNVFKSEAELKAEQDKIDELIRDNVDPSVSKILMSLSDAPVKNKKKTNTEKSSENANIQNRSVNLPRAKNGQFLKSTKKTCVENTFSTSEGHYTDTLTREEIINKLKQRDMKIAQQQHTIRDLQKTHLRDKVLIESLQIKLKLKNNQANEESLNAKNEETLQYTRPEFLFQKPAHQQRGIQTTNSEIQSDQNRACHDIYNRHLDIRVKKPTQQTNQKRVEATNSKSHQSNRNIPNQVFLETNRHSKIGWKKPAQQQIVTQNRERMATTNSENRNQSDRNFSEQNQTNVNAYNKQSDVELKNTVKKTLKRKRVEATNSRSLQSKRNCPDEVYFDTQNRHSEVGFKKPAQLESVSRNEKMQTTNLENLNQTKHSKVGLKKPAQQNKIVIQKQEILRPPNTENRNQHNMIFSDLDKRYFWNF